VVLTDERDERWKKVGNSRKLRGGEINPPFLAAHGVGRGNVITWETKGDGNMKGELRLS